MAPTPASPEMPRLGFLPLLEASRVYAIGQRRLYGLVHSGKIPSVRLGRRILVHPEAIEAWLIEQER